MVQAGAKGAFYRTKAEYFDRFPPTGGVPHSAQKGEEVAGRRRSPTNRDDQAGTTMMRKRLHTSRWLVYLLLLLSLSAFVYSLQLRQQDWAGVAAAAVPF